MGPSRGKLRRRRSKNASLRGDSAWKSTLTSLLINLLVPRRERGGFKSARAAGTELARSA